MLSSREPASDRLRNLLANHVVLETVWDREELFHRLQTSQYDAIICDCDFHKGEWKEVCCQIKQYDPNLPCIAACRLGGEQEWVEALESCCFDILSAPYSDSSVLGVLEHAVASCEALRWRIVA